MEWKFSLYCESICYVYDGSFRRKYNDGKHIDDTTKLGGYKFKTSPNSSKADSNGYYTWGIKH